MGVSARILMMEFLTAESLQTLLAIDALLVVVCVSLLLVKGRLAFGHPACIYLTYHIYCNSYRLFTIVNGAPTMYEWQRDRDPVSFQEIGRAMIWMDLALVLFSIGCFVAARRSENASGGAGHSFGALPRALNRKIVLSVSAICFPIGLVFLIATRGVAAIDLGGIGRTNYAVVVASWPIATIAFGLYILGFRWWLLIPLAAYLTMVSLQGYHRFMLLMPLLLVMYVYVFRRRIRWPPWYFVVVGFVVFSFFPLLKQIGRAYQQQDAAELEVLLSEGAANVAGLEIPPPENFLDQFASAMTLADEYGKIYFGANYAAFLTYPVPRVWWPEKPTINQFLADVETASRPMLMEGRIITYLGDAYVNFRYVGMVLYPIGLGWALSAWYFSSVRLPYDTLRRFCYVIIAPTMIQVWRDGILSMAMFTVVQFMPLIFIVGLHVVPMFRSSRREREQTYAALR